MCLELEDNAAGDPIWGQGEGLCLSVQLLHHGPRWTSWPKSPRNPGVSELQMALRVIHPEDAPLPFKFKGLRALC